jgi:hypothetical protein
MSPRTRRRSSLQQLTCCSSPSKSSFDKNNKRARQTSSSHARTSSRRLVRLDADRSVASSPIAEDVISPRTDAFQYFDTDKDGFITAQDLKTGLEMMGTTVTDEEVVEMMREAKADGDGRVTIQDLKSLLANYGVA